MEAADGAAYPDMRTIFEPVIVEGDEVDVYWTNRVTREGPYLEMGHVARRSADRLQSEPELGAYAHGSALALPEAVMARPTGLEPATFGSGTQRSIH